jgi:hypothetical protein
MGPILLILSGLLVAVSAQREWVEVLDEDDFHYRAWEGAYGATVYGSDIEEDVRVTIKEKQGRSISIVFWVEDYWEDEIFRESGLTPETYDIKFHDVFFLDDYEMFLEIDSDEYDIDDIAISVEKYDIGSRFIFSCLGASVVGFLGLLLLGMGIIFTAVYSSKMNKETPEYKRSEMIRKQELKIREEEARRGREMERKRQRHAMLMRARNLEASYRLDEAAYMYERLDMYEDAGRCRRMKKEDVSKHVHVNVNDLFEKLQKQGTALPYLCPRCHGMVDIDGGSNRHTRCPYCGASIDFDTLRKAAGDLLR